MCKGDILVTGMTDPDFVPFMKMASAIVTDKGGITSHAAIVSRELNIPCVVGTENAYTNNENRSRIHRGLKKRRYLRRHNGASNCTQPHQTTAAQ